MYKNLPTDVEIGKQYSGIIPISVSGRDPCGNPTFYTCKCVRCGRIIPEVHFLDIAWNRFRCCTNCDQSDLTGMRFGKLVAIRREDYKGINGKIHAAWLCKCDCGKQKVVRQDSLLLGLTRSCGCIKNYNMIGQRFGYLTVTKEIGVTTDHTKRFFYCKCDCGTTVAVSKGNLISGHTRSCGRCARTLDLQGKKFGRLTVIKLHPTLKRNTNRVWICKCDCGKTVYVPGHSLVSGHTKSCGCWREATRLFNTPDERRLAGILFKMIQRCHDPKSKAYKYYGARGIYVCDEWRNDRFKFISWGLNKGYKFGLSIDRIDNDGPYAPWNCRWATPQEQSSNRRSNHFIIVDGVKKTLSEWCRISKLPNWRMCELSKTKGDDYVAFVIKSALQRSQENHMTNANGGVNNE